MPQKEPMNIGSQPDMTDRCSCGREHVIKDDTPRNKHGRWPTCVCGSTSLIKDNEELRAQMSINKQNEQRLIKERREDNDGVKKSYRLIK